MKIKVSREKFQNALQRVSSIATFRSTLPVLGNICIKAEENRITLVATDIEIRVTTVIEGNVEEAGVTTLPSRRILALASGFVGDEVTIQVDENHHAVIRCGRSNFKLLGLSSETFPKEPVMEEVRSFDIDCLVFKKMLGMVSYAVSADDTRKNLTGVFCDVGENCVTVVATDGKRMAMQTNSSIICNGSGGAILPVKSVNELRRLLEESKNLHVEIDGKMCRFSSDDFVMVCKLIEATYPNYRLVIPKGSNREVEINTANLLSKVSIVSQVLSDNTAYVIFSFSENLLQIQGSSNNVGEGVDSVDIRYSDEPVQISFNPEFILSALKNCTTDTIRMKITDQFNPVAIEADEGFLYVIMPIRKK